MSGLSAPSFMENSSLSSAVDTSGKLNTSMIQKELVESLKDEGHGCAGACGGVAK